MAPKILSISRLRMRARLRPLSAHAYLVLCPCADCSAGVPAAWRRLSEFALRPGQEKTAATKSGLWIHQSESPRERPAHEARLLHAAEQHDLPRLPLALRTAVERYEVMLQHYDEPVHAWVRELDDALTAAVALFGSRWRTVHPLITHHPRAKPLTLSSMRGRWCRGMAPHGSASSSRPSQQTHVCAAAPSPTPTLFLHG